MTSTDALRWLLAVESTTLFLAATFVPRAVLTSRRPMTLVLLRWALTLSAFAGAIACIINALAHAPSNPGLYAFLAILTPATGLTVASVVLTIRGARS